jgi:hypothetical protein
MNKFDIDGDGEKDKIEYCFSGGAHCCYKISVLLSKNKKRYDYPFEMDGGYVGGLDLSQTNHFFIKDYDKYGLPEIFMKITWDTLLLRKPLNNLIKYCSMYVVIPHLMRNPGSTT